MRKITSFALVLLFASYAYAQDGTPGVGFGTQAAWDNPMQNIGDGQSKPGYQRIQWEPGMVMPLKLRDGMLTIINFPEWETIRDAYVGDKDFFDGRPVEKNTFMISPVDGRAMADTNLFIFGSSGNRYVFYLRSEPFTSDRITSSIVDVVVPNRFRKGSAGAMDSGGGGAPGGGMQSMMSGKSFSTPTDDDWEGEDFGWIKSIPIDPTEFRFDLDVFVPNPDDYVIAPERVWRDQVFTYIDFGERSINMNQRPVVSILVEEGESPVGFRTDGPQSRLLVVEAIGDIVLRSGGRLVCIKLRAKPYLLSNPPPPQELVAVAGSMGASMGSNVGGGGFGGGFPAGGGGMHPGAGQFGAQTGGYMGGLAGGYMPPMATFPMPGPMMPMGAPPPQMTDAKANPRATGRTMGSALPNHFVPLVRQNDNNVAVEIFQGKSVVEIEQKWLELTEKLPWLDEYTPFYSVETSGVDMLGQQRYYGGELYRLRIGPFSQMEVANEVCSKLSVMRTPCSVVRTQ